MTRASEISSRLVQGFSSMPHRRKPPWKRDSSAAGETTPPPARRQRTEATPTMPTDRRMEFADAASEAAPDKGFQFVDAKIVRVDAGTTWVRLQPEPSTRHFMERHRVYPRMYILNFPTNIFFKNVCLQKGKRLRLSLQCDPPVSFFF